jgi:pSer/pThr/pTyr-binding forkhead associated (FHA) protein
VLYSSVVSRHHVEIRRINNVHWEISNLGTNGTYIDGKRISKFPAENGIIFQLARSGPQIQIYTNKQPVKTIWPHIAGANPDESELTEPDITISEPHQTCP